MKTGVTLFSLATLVSSVFAGLEDAKYSTVLNANNFDQVIASQSHGTLVAFFAPWCGHCKSLEPTWTKVAGAFEGDERCKLGHLDADQASAKALAQKYGVTGFPTIRFIPSGGKPPIDFQQSRSEEAILEFMNEHCGTAKLPGGRLSALAGRVPSLDELASQFFAPSAVTERSTLYERAVELAENLKDDTSAFSSYYIKVMSKWLENTDGAQEWMKKEGERLAKLMSRKGAIAGKKLDELQMKTNILNAFQYVEKTAENVVDRIKEEL